MQPTKTRRVRPRRLRDRSWEPEHEDPGPEDTLRGPRKVALPGTYTRRQLGRRLRGRTAGVWREKPLGMPSYLPESLQPQPAASHPDPTYVPPGKPGLTEVGVEDGAKPASGKRRAGSLAAALALGAGLLAAVAAIWQVRSRRGN